jgi:hypothetical protein
MKATAEMADAEWTRLAALPITDRYEAIKAHDKAASRINMARGSLIHEWAEDLLHHRPFRFPLGYEQAVVDQATPYQSALHAFFDAHQPELVAAEVVCLHRTLNGIGYGGAADAFVRIDGGVWVVDWKSRASDHAAYLEEAAQGGGYAGAEYMIVTGPDGNPMRTLIPDVAGVLIVSIRTDGFRAYPIDRDGAVKAYAAMHRWWVEQRAFTDDKVIGKPWAPKAATPTSDRDALRARLVKLLPEHEEQVRAWWPQGVPPLSKDGHTADQLAALRHLLERVEAEIGAPFDPLPQPLVERPEPAAVFIVHPPDDGGEVGKSEMAALKRRMTALPDERQKAVAMIAAEAHDAGRSISVQAKPCVRRWEIARALVRWAETSGDIDGLAEAVIAIADLTGCGDDVGGWLSLFTIEQARRLHDAFDVSVAA